VAAELADGDGSGADDVTGRVLWLRAHVEDDDLAALEPRGEFPAVHDLDAVAVAEVCRRETVESRDAIRSNVA